MDPDIHGAACAAESRFRVGPMRRGTVFAQRWDRRVIPAPQRRDRWAYFGASGFARGAA